MNNREIAEIFHSIADILEIKSENPFRIRAYRKAAQTIEDLPQSIK
ncbi:DNA-binding protein, partial [bacterium]|nr:DNA-binding protein [bacterium]